MSEVPRGRQGAETPKNNVIDFEAARQHLSEKRQRQSETRQDKQIRRALQSPPRLDEERRQSVKDAVAHGEGARPEVQAAPIDGAAVQESIDRMWRNELIKEMVINPNRQATDAEWERLQRLDPSLSHLGTWGVYLDRRIHALKEQPGGDSKAFDALWQKELDALHAEAEKKKTEEWAKVGITRLPQEEWEKQSRASFEAGKEQREKKEAERLKFREEAEAQWEKYQAETTPEERERIQKHLAEKSARIRSIPLETIAANMRSWHRASQLEETRKQAYIHAGDPNYDPMTGELLKPDEHRLSPTSEYLITGKTRPRRFVPPGSQHLKEYKPLEIQEDMQPEGEYNERLIQRLIKAGFTEVAPVGDDWQYFAFCERLRHMSPTEISREWQEIQRAMRKGTPLKKEYPPENDWLLLLCKMLKDMMKALINDQIEEDERQRKQSSTL